MENKWKDPGMESGNDWKQDERIRHISPKKLDFLQKLVFEMDTIGPKERLPFLLALANRAKKENISFSTDEVNTIIAVLKENSTPDEVQKMDKIIKMFQKR